MYNQQLANRITQFLQKNPRYFTAAELTEALNMKYDNEFHYVIYRMLWCDEVWEGSNGKGIRAFRHRESSTVLRCPSDLFPSEFKP